MIQHFDLRDVALSENRITIRSAHKEDEELLLRWFDPEDAIDRCEVRVIEEFTIWPFIVIEPSGAAGFAQAWMTAGGTGGLEVFVAAEFRRRRVATAALRLLSVCLREKAGWKRITIEPHMGDDAAIACCRKAGFVDRGARRDDGDHTHIILEWP